MREINKTNNLRFLTPVVFFILISTFATVGHFLGSPPAMGAQGSPVAEKDFLQGYAAFVAGDYPKARLLWLKAATGGNSNAMAAVGYLYNKGWGVPPDYRKAADWYERAATAGDLNARYDLGICYQRGRGRKQNYALAMKWYQSAAALDFAPAMYAIGQLYSLGDGVPKDPAKALKWYRMAAAAGNGTAMSELANVYRFGIGVPRDRQKAQMWSKKATLASLQAGLGSALRGALAGESRSWAIHNGFGGKPCDIELRAMRMHSRLTSLSVDVISGQNDVGLSEFSGPQGRGMAPCVVVLAQGHGASHKAPSVLVNNGWQIGGGLGPRTFQYGSETYRYDKAKDIWIPVKKRGARLK